ncbi:class I SAM-dependent methyltransferase [Eubacterium barkeri]|uniref:Methyltransferase domain-containing protein n=1 Tax=Eubacterium barkeri TaxID=1528 RepID=A0A1H3FST0_EUBBA|nr:class I SAM-dependent methyltransferase [Eubacterium barkeri]SDX93438.1 Methyltransferase domain-containing protein [Eubacterium barkeri]
MPYDINTILKKPELYKETGIPFWDDEHISKQMLKAHLNSEYEGASRSFAFIDQSVKWIKALVPSAEYPQLLDVGCGPGLYAERFAKAGYHVTGVDFSKRSIQHAVSSAEEQGLDITYHYQDYLQLALGERFNLVAMIYCDYGALSQSNRQRLLQRIYEHLKPGGRFLLDVFSMKKFAAFAERQTWERCPDGGFWTEQPHTVINGNYRYCDNVTLEQIVVLTQSEVSVYYLWTTYFTPESLIEEALAAGFKRCGVFSDVAGTTYSQESQTIAVLLEK